MKTCRICFETLPETHFYHDPKYKDGRKSHCRTCHWAQGQKRQKVTVAPAHIRCLHGGCCQEGTPQPEGYGFRFCDDHLPDWVQVRDRTGAPIQTRSKKG